MARRASPQLQVGEVLDAESGCRYEILERLGRGGMAEVYRARSVRPTGFTSDVALKRLLKGMDDEESSMRLFQYEAEVSGHLNHPNIARALDLERVQGRLYLVLEYVDGVSLRAVMHAALERKTELSLELACYVCAAIAEALSYAHSLADQGGKALEIIHRDVAPSNVMVTRRGIPKLLDFGIAFSRVPERDHTATGVVLGTYSYLSPEQAASGRAARGEVDGRSDLFSLGLILVELLTGRKVFRAEDEYLTAKAIAECSPARVNEAIRELPTELQRVCRRLLVKHPKDRFQTGEELAQALRVMLAERDPLYGSRDCVAELTALGLIAAGAGKTISRTPGSRKRRRRHAATWGATVAVALAIGVGSGAGGSLLLRRGAERTPAASPAQPAQEEPPTADPLVFAPNGSAPAAAEPTVPSPASVPPTTSSPEAPAAAPQALGAASGNAPGPVAPATARSGAPAAATYGWPDGSPVRKKRFPRRDAAPAEKPTAAAVAPEREPAKAPETALPPEKEPEPEPEPRVPSASHGALQRVADRGTVSSAASTLPRGTVMRVRLAHPLVPERGATVEVALTEAASANGNVVVPRGAIVTCHVGAAVGERVNVTCESAAAGERAWSFSALALGDGDRAGLRLVDGVVPGGTVFSVAVTASAMLE